MHTILKKPLVFVVSLCLTGVATAGIVLDSTRVIYREGEREADVRMTNSADMPVIVQSWIDNGAIDRGRPVDEIVVPFNLTPPVSRVDPARGQTLRIFAADSSEFEKDRETLFWLNVLEIPPKIKETGKNRIEFTIRNSIKVFYRPSSIGKDVPSDAYKEISFRLKRSSAGKYVLVVHNPTPFYYTFTSIEAKGPLGVARAPIGMAPPLSTVEISPEKGDFKDVTKVSAFYVNDWGVGVPVSYELIQ